VNIIKRYEDTFYYKRKELNKAWKDFINVFCEEYGIKKFIRFLNKIRRLSNMYWNFKDLPKEYKTNGSRLWAFDYANANSEKTKSLKAQPYVCEISAPWRDKDELLTSSDNCYKVKNNGKRGAQRVSCSSRHYALTKEDAIKGYNELVDDVVGFLIRMAKVYESDKIGGK